MCRGTEVTNIIHSLNNSGAGYDEFQILLENQGVDTGNAI